ncbi:hypothetical protein C8J56DRAFT_1042476 [Mycena floridula]|nr:hypothetical protein C8J56DRAFT_1042476 [Mycena floridula]
MVMGAGSARRGFPSIFNNKWHHPSLPHVPFIAVAKPGSTIWFQRAEESSEELFKNKGGNWVLDEDFEKPITLQLHRLARARTAIQGHIQFHGNRSDGVEFITAHLREAHSTEDALVKTMLKAKIAANFWMALICWWMVVYPDWVRMENSLEQILEKTWVSLQDCDWVGVVVDLTRDKLTALFTMMALNHVTCYYPWTLGTARDASLTRFSPALMDAFDQFRRDTGRHGSWDDLEEETQHSFPLATNYDLLLQDASIRADLSSSLNEIPRDGSILIIPSAGWRGYFLEGPRRFNIGKEWVRSRAHQLDHVENKPVVVIYLSLARRDSNITVNELYRTRDLLRYRRGPAWDEIISAQTGLLERPGFLGLDRGIMPLAISENRQPINREVTLLGAIGGKGAVRPIINVDYDMDDGTKDKGKTVLTRKRGHTSERDDEVQRQREESYERYLSAGEESPRSPRSQSVSQSRSTSRERGYYSHARSSSHDSDRSDKIFVRKSWSGGRFITREGWIEDKDNISHPQDTKPLLSQMSDNPSGSLLTRIASPPPVTGHSETPVERKATDLVVTRAGPSFTMVLHKGSVLQGMLVTIANNLTNLASKLLLPSTYKARNPGILSINHGYLVVDNPQLLCILKLITNVQPRIHSVEELLIEAVRRGIPIRIAYHKEDIIRFRPVERDLQRIEKEKVYYEAGYEEPHLEFRSGGKQLANQLTGFANLAFSRLNAQSFFSEGGSAAWVAWQEAPDELKEKIFKGPLAQSYEYRKGEKNSRTIWKSMRYQSRTGA